MGKPTYNTNDIWQGAYLICYGIRLLTTTIGADGRATWVFDNTDPVDGAWQAGVEFRSGDNATVPALRYRTAFRFLSKSAQDARGTSYDYPNTR